MDEEKNWQWRMVDALERIAKVLEIRPNPVTYVWPSPSAAGGSAAPISYPTVTFPVVTPASYPTATVKS